MDPWVCPLHLAVEGAREILFLNETPIHDCLIGTRAEDYDQLFDALEVAEMENDIADEFHENEDGDLENVLLAWADEIEHFLNDID